MPSGDATTLDGAQPGLTAADPTAAGLTTAGPTAAGPTTASWTAASRIAASSPVRDRLVESVQRRLAEHLTELLEDQITAGPDAGAITNRAWGVPQPYRAAWAAAALALADEVSATDLEKVGAAVDHLLATLRRQPLLDLPECNYDSAPDTAFAVQLLVAALEAGADRPELADLLARCRECVALALPAMATGGFHTPNHRWVLASALTVGARALGVPRPASVDDLLAEGFDLDAEGAWIERSAGVYDAVCDRAVLLLAEAGAVEPEAARELVARNLRLNELLLQADGTIETGLSSRQDRGKAVVPHELAPVMVALGGPWAPLAGWLWDHGDPSIAATIWMADALRRHPDADLTPVPPPNRSRLLTRSGVWRHRHGALAVTAAAERADVVAVRFGALAATIRLHHLYFSPDSGAFVPEDIEPDGDGVRLVGSGTRDPRRPGYELPLGRPVPHEDWDAALADRDLRRLKPLRTEMTVTPVGESVEVAVRTLSGHPGVLAVLAVDLPAGIEWTGADVAFRPAAGQTLVLRRGSAEVRLGRDVLRLGPGADAHRVVEPRNLEPAGAGLVRVLVPLATPIEHTLTLAGG